MKILVNIIKFILMTVLTISIISIGMITIVSSTVLNQEYVISKLEETDFYSQTYELVKSNFENYIQQSGLDETVLEDIVSEEKVKNDINLMLSNIYKGTNQKIDTTEIANNLNKNIDELNIKNSKNESSINKFIEYICKEYTDTLIHTNYEQRINNIYEKLTITISKVKTASIIVLSVIIITLLIINNKRFERNIRQIGISLLSAGLFQTIVYNVIISNVRVQGIKIFNDIFSKTLVTIIQDILSKILNMGNQIMILSIILFIIYFVMKLIVKDNNKGQVGNN